MKYVLFTATLLIFINGCNSKIRDNIDNNTILGSWYTKDIKSLSNGIRVEILRKENFLQNGLLQSTKWIHYTSANGFDLGEFYITKLFKWRANYNSIEVRFQRCSTSITKELKIGGLGYNRLHRRCNLERVSNKITTKSYILKRDYLYLGSKKYLRDR